MSARSTGRTRGRRARLSADAVPDLRVSDLFPGRRGGDGRRSTRDSRRKKPCSSSRAIFFTRSGTGGSAFCSRSARRSATLAGLLIDRRQRRPRQANRSRRRGRGASRRCSASSSISTFSCSAPTSWRARSASRTNCRFSKSCCRSGSAFFTFHGISYITDVYRGDVAVCREPLDMALYMSFFPQLVAGPIVRAAYFLPQLARPSTEPIPIAPALLLILLGLFKKVVIANYLATGLVDPVFAAPTELRRAGPAARRSMATRCRSIAISAPIATWRSRWRRCSASAFRPISTSPTGPSGCASSGSAGTSRCRAGCATISTSRSAATGTARLKTYRNLMLTMLLGGIWHGAAWKFVMWGALHGGGLGGRADARTVARDAAGEPAGAARRGAGRVPFRVPGLDLLPGRGFHDGAGSIIAGLGAGWEGGLQQAGPLMVALIALGLAGQFTAGAICSSAPPRRSAGCRSGAWASTAGIVVAAINALGPEGVAPFIYFQF